MALFRKRDLQIDSFERRYAGKSELTKVANSDSGANFDIFLSHSHDDADLIAELYRTITAMGFSVYVDWIVDKSDKNLAVTPDNARWVRHRMRHCKSLLYATSSNAAGSKWMPWELGFFDGFNGTVAILPIVEDGAWSDDFRGQEFLGIYPYVTRDKPQGEDRETLWARNNPQEYIIFSAWLRGNKPYARS